MKDQSKQGLLKRLATIEGHVRAVRSMVEDERYCVDVARQSFAIGRALKGFEGALLSSHFASCVPEGFRAGNDEAMVRELSELFELSRKA